MPARCCCRAAWMSLTLLLLPLVAGAAEPDAAQAEFFEKKIRPLLATRCFDCHAGDKSKGGLNLESHPGLLAGGDSGETIIPGKPDESLLIEAVRQTGDISMPPKTKLSDEEIADLVRWVELGAPWPSVTVSIPLGNLFDDDAGIPLGNAVATDEFKASADLNDLAIDRVLAGLGGPVEIAPGLRFDFRKVGGDGRTHGLITNDAWNLNGGIRTRGEKFDENGPRTEEGIGMHANALITFDLTELRKAGGLPGDQAFQFRVDRAGLNDDILGNGEASAHLIVLISRTGKDGSEILTAWINGQTVAVRTEDGILSLDVESPAPLKANGEFAACDLPVPAEATMLTLVTTGAGLGGGDNTISSDHAVFSGVRLEFATTSSRLARLGRESLDLAPFVITQEQRQFWSFQPVVDPPLPAVQNEAWIRRPWDRFILQKLEAAGLQPVAAAERRSLIRRATFDLIGLPPTAAEVEAFVTDSDPNAFEKVVDRLLASPHYGERWGRYWLDVARYAEDQAHTFQARVYPEAFRYRDWVVRAFNEDMPFEKFVAAQIAGDLLEPAENLDRQIPLGYFALGPVYYADAGCAPKAAADELDDRIDTLARGFLGLTVSCARCHDHKFDPISQFDYYGLAGVFSSSAYREAPLVPQATIDLYNQGQQRIQEQDRAVQEFVEETTWTISNGLVAEIPAYFTAHWKWQIGQKQRADLPLDDIAKEAQLSKFLLERWSKYLKEAPADLPSLTLWRALPLATDTEETGLAEARLAEVRAAAEAFRAEIAQLQAIRDADLTEAEQQDRKKQRERRGKLTEPQANFLKQIVGKEGVLGIPQDRLEKLVSEEQKTAWNSLKTELDSRRQAAPPKYPVAHSLTEGTAANMPVYIRGNHTKKGPEAPRRFISVLSPAEPVPFSQGSGRLELAAAISSPDNPLTARVFVNRIWRHHFGRGIVGTPSNFGQLGERPSHPELLDHLVSKFWAAGGSVKALHRELMLSATYQMATTFEPHNFEVDPDNRLYWRTNRRRLDVEAWRDALLRVSGNLQTEIGGPSGDLANSGYARRTLYGKISRHQLDGLLRLFDFPDPNITSEARTQTTVPLQQLFVLNSDFMIGQARTLAGRLAKEAGDDDAARIRHAFPLLYGRPATERDVALGLAFLQAAPLTDENGKTVEGRLSPWEQYAQILLSANEFLYLD